jgi:hypothetical protein
MFGNKGERLLHACISSLYWKGHKSVHLAVSSLVNDNRMITYEKCEKGHIIECKHINIIEFIAVQYGIVACPSICLNKLRKFKNVH